MKTSANGRQEEESEQRGTDHLLPVRVPALHTPTSLAEASALQTVACLVCGGHQGLGKAAVGKDGAVGRAAVTGPMAGEITVVLRG